MKIGQAGDDCQIQRDGTREGLEVTIPLRGDYTGLHCNTAHASLD